MAVPTARITAQHLQTTSFQGQMVRAVGKLVGEGENSVTLQLAGEGAAAPRPSSCRPCLRHPVAPRVCRAPASVNGQRPNTSPPAAGARIGALVGRPRA